MFGLEKPTETESNCSSITAEAATNPSPQVPHPCGCQIPPGMGTPSLSHAERSKAGGEKHHTEEQTASALHRQGLAHYQPSLLGTEGCASLGSAGQLLSSWREHNQETPGEDLFFSSPCSAMWDQMLPPTSKRHRRSRKSFRTESKGIRHRLRNWAVTSKAILERCEGSMKKS